MKGKNPPLTVPNRHGLSKAGESPFGSPHRWMWALFIFAMTIRLIYLWQISGEFWFLNPMLDAEYYNDWAERIIQGNWIGDEVFFMSPGYPYFLALLYKIFSHNTLTIAVVQMLMGSLCCVWVFRIAQKIFGLREALLASVLLATYGAVIFNEAMLLKVAAINFLNVLILLFLIKETGEPKKMWIFLAGSLCGISAQFRPTVLLFVPLVLFWLLGMTASKGWKMAVTSCLAFGLGVFTIVMPVAFRNYWVGKQFILTTAHGGFTFYVGNHPGADGTHVQPDFARSDPKHEQKDAKIEAIKRSGRQLNDQEANDFWYRQTFAHIRENPGGWLFKLGQKFVVFWNQYEHPINIDYNYFKKETRTIINFINTRFDFIAVTSLLGLGIGLIRKFRWQDWFNPLVLLWMYLAVYTGTCVLFKVTSEYRMPVIPVLVIFSGKAMVWLWQKWQSRRLAHLGIAVSACALLFAFTHIKIPTSDDCNSRYNIAQYLKEKRNYKKAMSELEKAVEGCPEYLDARLSLASTYLFMGEHERASNQLLIAKKLKPADYRVNLQLGNLAFSRKRYLDSVTYYQHSLTQGPRDPPVQAEIQNNLGNSLTRLKRYSQALNHYERALKLAPDAAATYQNRAFAYLQMGDRANAMRSYLRAIELKPDYLKARIKLARLYMDAGQYREALIHLEHSLRLSPNDPKVQSYIMLCRKQLK